MRPHRPLHTPTVSPWWPTRAAPCAWPLAVLRGVHHHRYRARVELPSAPRAPRSRRPHGRTCDRRVRVCPGAPFVARGSRAPGPKPWRRVTRRRPMDRRLPLRPRRCRRDGFSLTRLTPRARAHGPRTRRLHLRTGVRPAETCLQAAIARVAPGDGKVTHEPAPPHRRVPPPRTAGDQGRRLSAWLVLPGWSTS